jgi:ADP-heptose:LPS heptosyltransferase
MSKKNLKSKKSRFKFNDSPQRWRKIYKEYGLTKEKYTAILNLQKGCCAICLRFPEKIKPRRNLAVDHNHATGEIRGLLCYRCNHVLLGRIFRDDVNMAKRAYLYLKEKELIYGKVPGYP